MFGHCRRAPQPKGLRRQHELMTAWLPPHDGKCDRPAPARDQQSPSGTHNPPQGQEGDESGSQQD